jgi:uncharacterized hydrophobic protein (TIGR00341 family)
MRIIEVIADCGHSDTLNSIAEQYEILEHWTLPTAEEDDTRCITRMLVIPEKQQKVIDAVQLVLEKAENARMMILPVEATLPYPEVDAEAKEKRAKTRSREELYSNIIAGSTLDSNFIYMVILSTIVAAIGLLEDNVAVVIGAMVIAPLLGPNIALAFATSLGDTKLIGKAFKTNITGLGIALLLSVALGYAWPLNFESRELMMRTGVDIDGIVLALASGAAAVLSLTSSWINSLVGVMVAVALLPPTATLGLMFGAGHYQEAIGAALLLAVNVVCVNLSAKLSFLAKGIKPRTWIEKEKGRQSVFVSAFIWILLLIILITIIIVRRDLLPV